MKNDIHYLRAQANACLAKEEKEFRSTIVVSDTDMFVLPNSSTATKRSSRKPKRFTSDDSAMNDPEMEAIFRVKRKRGNPKQSDSPIDKPKPNVLPPGFVDGVQHVSIQLDRFPDCGIEPWCMIHQLYKCHCKGKSQKGHPFTITIKKNTADTHGGWEVVSSRKRQYTFERDHIAGGANKGTRNSDAYPTSKYEVLAKVRKLSNASEPTAKTSLQALYLAARVIPIDRSKLKRKKAHEIRTLRNTCTFAETPFSELLKERIEACRNYNKAQNILMKTSNAQQQHLLRDANRRAFAVASTVSGIAANTDGFGVRG